MNDMRKNARQHRSGDGKESAAAGASPLFSQRTSLPTTKSPLAPPRLPAEFEPHAATWIAWPFNAHDWPGKFGAIGWAFVEMVRQLAPEPVQIIVADKTGESRARSMLGRAHVDPKRLDFVHHPLDRSWARDFSPTFVLRGDALEAVNFGFTGWAKYPNHHKDAAAKPVMVDHIGCTWIEPLHHDRPVVLEGGAIDANGAGLLLTTEECLLHPSIQVRNLGMDKKTYEDAFAEFLGVSQTIWLGDGIAGDDTHGHVDDLCRFVAPYTVVLCQEPNGNDPNHRPLAENRERLEQIRLPKGQRLEIIPLPMPDPLHFEGLRLPASYANFFIGNNAVLVPTFNDPKDRQALGLLADLFPTKRVVGVHAVDLVWGFGTIHCLTHEEPAA